MRNLILDKLVEYIKKPAIAWIFAALMAGVATLAKMDVPAVKEIVCSAPTVELKK